MKRLALISILYLFFLTTLVACNAGKARGVVLDTTDQLTILADYESIIEVEISALVQNVGEAGPFTINVLLEPEGYQAMEDSKTEYFEKDVKRRVFFFFTMDTKVDYSYSVWVTK